jgi:hypothetical protein
MHVLIADAALPLIYFTLSAVILMLVPVILLEGVLLGIWLPTSTWEALKVSAVSNAISTLASVQLASPPAFSSIWAVSPWTQHPFERALAESAWYVLMAILNSVYISAYVVEARWLFPAALLTILVPAYLISWQIEYRIVKRMTINDAQRSRSEKASPAAINRAVRRANFASYGLLYAIIAIRLVHSQL